MDPRNSAGPSAYGSAGASGQFDPATFIRKPQVLLRMIAVVSWFHMALILWVYWTCWSPVTHAQTWASYSAVYRFCTGSLSLMRLLPYYTFREEACHFLHFTAEIVQYWNNWTHKIRVWRFM